MREGVFNRAMPVAHAAASAAFVGLAAYAERDRRGGTPTLVGPLVDVPVWPLARKLGLYYMTFSILGHWVEILFCLGIKHGIFKGGYDRGNHMLWDQWLFPFPAEGTAAVLAELTLLPVRRALHDGLRRQGQMGRIAEHYVTPLAVLASFLFNQVVCTSIDFGTGMVANRNYELWDYRDMKFHFMGQVCLQNSLFYSVIATWATWRLLPRLDALVDGASDTALDGTLVGLGSFFVFLELIYHVIPRNRALPADTAGATCDEEDS